MVGRVLLAVAVLLTPLAVVPTAVSREARIGWAALATLALVRFAFARPLLAGAVTLGLAPLAIGWEPAGGGFEVTVPLEPMLIACALAATARLCAGRLAPPLLRSPVTLVAAASLCWTACSAALSEVPLVSAKALLVEALAPLALFLGGLACFRRPRLFVAATAAHAAGLCAVLGHALYRHLEQQFDPAEAYDVAAPFFANRLELLAVTTLLLPVALAVLVARRSLRVGPLPSLAFAAVLVTGLAAIQVLHVRSAALGLVVAAACLPLIAWTPPRRATATLIVIGLAGASLLADFVGYQARRRDLSLPMARRAVYDAVLDTGITTDASLAERMNRWRSATALGTARPFAGEGPGLFERSYGRVQRRWDTTRTSTWAGDRGDAHSAYASAFAEKGLPGLALVIALFVACVHEGALAAQRSGPGLRALALGATASIAGFAAANLFNGFLEHDKVAPLFWVLAAGVVSLAGSRSAAATSPGTS